MNTKIVFIFLSALFLFARGSDEKTRVSMLRRIHTHDSFKYFPEGKDVEPIALQFAMYLINVADVDPVKKEVEVDAWLELQWKSGIAWSAGNGGIKTLLVPVDDIWVPDISVFNSVNKLTNDAPDIVRVSNDGNALWMPKVRIRSLCDVDPNKMASNVTCSLQFGPWVNSDNEVNIVQLYDKAVNLEYYFAGSRFQILETSSERVAMRFECCEDEVFTHLKLNFSFKERHPTHHHCGCAQGSCH